MKKKWTKEGIPYYFSTDQGLDKLALSIINFMKMADITPTMTMGERLWGAAYEYVKYNLDDQRQMVFSRPTLLDPTETEMDRVLHWCDEAINAILKSINNKETRLNTKFVEEKNNGKGLTRFKTAGGDFILKGLFSPTIMLLSPQDYRKLNEIVKDKLKINLNELTGQQFYRLQSDIANNKREMLKTLPSLKSGFLPDNWDKTKTKIETQKELFVQLMRNETSKDKAVPRTTNTLDVFDNIEDAL